MGLAGVLPPGVRVLNNCTSLRILSILANSFAPFKQGSSMGAASGESDFEKLHFLENFVNLSKFFVAFKQGSSRGAASGGSDF